MDRQPRALALCVAGRDACQYRVATQEFAKKVGWFHQVEAVNIGDVKESSLPSG